MEGFLRVDSVTTTLPGSPTNSFLADEVASTCPLLTPSPPTNDLINALSDKCEPTFIIGEALASKLQQVKDDDKTAGDSGSSSSSVLAEPVCTQLLNHRHHYQHITKDENATSQETNGKVQQMQLTFRNPPDDYCFMKWNWPLIRKLSLWTFMSGLLAMVALVIMMVSSLPCKCNPPTKWFQGNLLYEIFPASFHDTDDDGIGDLKGISFYADYIQKLGVRGVRLNSIFPAINYPEDYKNVTTLMEIELKLGTLKDFKIMTDSLNLRNISLILDLPIFPYIKKLSSHKINEFNESGFHGIEFRSIMNPYGDEISESILFWLQYGVDGFYLKGVEEFLDDPNFGTSLIQWKKLLGPERALIVNEDVLTNSPKDMIDTILEHVDLIDIKIDAEFGVNKIKNKLDKIQNGTLFTQMTMPWVHWTLGNVDSERLGSRLHFGNATLGATLLQLMLPGTPSIFYGDEIGMQQILDPHGDKHDLKHIHQLGAMIWQSNYKFTHKNVLPWMHGVQPHSNFEQFDLISKMVETRSSSPSIYMNAVQKDGQNKANSEIKYSQGDLLVVQRYYPRRKSFVVVSNLGKSLQSADLSKLLYSGNIVVGPKTDSQAGSISFKDISLWPGESVVIILD